MLRDVVIVGGSLAGLRAAEGLRSGGFEGTITLIGAEPHVPYDRPPLSKRLLSGEWEPDRIALRKPDDIGSIDVDWRLGVAAEGLDLEEQRVVLADGERVSFDGLVLATGAAVRRLPGQDEHRHVTVLRTVDDAIDLRERIVDGGRRVVVVGAGFIGLEVAATARTLGNEVLVVEGASAPLSRAFGPEMGAAVAAFHADHGVEIRCDVQVEGFVDGAVVVDGGRHEPADVVVVGIGVAPATGWLDGAGLRIDDGIVCGADLNVGHPGVYAAGDVARWHHPLYDEPIRIEHWTNAAEQGAHAAANLLDEGGPVLLERAVRPADPVPRPGVGRRRGTGRRRLDRGAPVRRDVRPRRATARRARRQHAAPRHALPEAPARPDRVGRGARARRRALTVRRCDRSRHPTAPVRRCLGSRTCLTCRTCGSR
jgi:NADPH-dependent 2,4-dienoyl-CoA reductase/sulfur reductase-like enzyme